MHTKHSKRKYGVMGGTFNPIHYGHLVTAEEALSQFKLDEVVFMPTGHPPHKAGNNLVEPEERYLMTVMATASNPCFAVSRFEVEKEEPSYTIETVEHLSEQFGDNIDIFFITGADAVLEIITWKEPEKLAKYCSFIAATRPGYDLTKFKDTIDKMAGKGAEMPKVFTMEIPALAISSTDIRNRVKTERPIMYLLPESVARYIKKKKFYKQ